MRQLFTAGNNNGLFGYGSNYEYISLIGDTWSSSTGEYYTSHVIPLPCVVKNLKVTLGTAPGTANTRTLTVLKDNVATALTLTLSDAETTGEDTTHAISFAAGDRIVIKHTSTGTPVSSTSFFIETEIDTLSGTKCIIFGNSLCDGARTVYAPLSQGEGLRDFTDENRTRQCIPIPGKISDLYIALESDPGTSPEAYKLTVRKGGASQTLTTTITADNTTGNDTTHSFTVVAGDLVNMMIEPLNSPAVDTYCPWGMVFTADEPGKFIILGGSNNDLNDTNTEYNHVQVPNFSPVWDGTIANMYQKVRKVTITDLYMVLSGDPGADNSYTFTLMDSAVATDLTVTISDTDTSGSDTTNSASYSDGDLMTLRCVPTGTPTVRDVYWGVAVQVLESYTADFRILYPGGYSSYDYTYLSDKPAVSDHQFREFEWRDQPKIPNVVYVLANQSADGTWDNVITGGGEQYAKADNNEYPDIVMYHIASTLTTQANADARAAAIALRMWMEAQLGRVVVPHNCGQELYDWIKVRDKRGTGTYTDYPPARWGNGAIVGSLTHIYDPVNGVYDLEITINGIESSVPVDATIPTLSRVLEDIGEAKIDIEGMKETIRAFSPPEDLAENLEAFAKGMDELRFRVETGAVSPERMNVTYQEWAKKFGYAPALFKEKADWIESRRIMKKYYDWLWGLE